MTLSEEIRKASSGSLRVVRRRFMKISGEFCFLFHVVLSFCSKKFLVNSLEIVAVLWRVSFCFLRRFKTVSRNGHSDAQNVFVEARLILFFKRCFLMSVIIAEYALKE